MPDLRDNPVPHRVRRDGDGVRLADYLLALIPRTTEHEVAQAIADGRFRWSEGGGPLGPDALLVAGQTLLATTPDLTPDDPHLPPPPEVMTVLHADADLFIVDKPPGLLSYPQGTRKVAAQSIAEQQLMEAFESPELRPLHRIDRETSGVLMFARHIEADRRVKAAFQRRAVRKGYLALVRGAVPDGEHVIDARIGPDGGDIRIRMRVRSDGLTAQTVVRTLGRFGDDDFGAAGRGYSWVEAKPRTGRTHQIRLHLAHLGHPIVGDKLYIDGGKSFLRWWDGDFNASDIAQIGLPRHALHAGWVTLTQPMTKERLQVVSPVPEDLRAFAQARGGLAPELVVPPEAES